MELWDAYDSAFCKIPNKQLVRGEPVPDGMFHLVCDVIVRHTDGAYLLMQRDPRKPWGGMWEATVGGSALAGETPLDCALRELREETGIIADRLAEVGRMAVPEHRSIYVEFLCEIGWDKTAVTLQEGETVAFRWVGREELLRMDRDELVTKRMQQFMEDLKK